MALLRVALLISVALTLTAAVKRKELILCYDEWPPSTIFPSEKNFNRGFTIDLMQSVFAKHGYDVVFREVPYARGIEMTATGQCHLLAEVPDGVQEKNILFPEESTFAYKQAFFIRRGSNWKYKGVNSLKGLRVGNIVGYDYSQLDPDFQRFLKDPKKSNQITVVGGTDGIQQLMRLIAIGRLDTFNEAFLIGSYVIQQNGLQDQLTVGGYFSKPLVEKPVFSPKNPESAKLMKIWDEDRKNLRLSGRDLKFLEKYGLKSVE